MRSLKVLCGIAAAGILLSGCGGSGAAPAPNAISAGSSTSSSSIGQSGSSSGSSNIGNATVSWTAPTTYTNGNPLTLSDLQGFHIHYGTSSASLSQEITVPSASASSYTIADLASGTWYFAVSAYTSQGESTLSAVASKTIS